MTKHAYRLITTLWIALALALTAMPVHRSAPLVASGERTQPSSTWST